MHDEPQRGIPISNKAQRDFWNGAAGDVWVEAQEIMDGVLEPLSTAVLQAAAAQTGERVIDIGCGCGDTSFALAETGAEVWGLDISTPMIARARERAAGLERVAFSVGDAATQDYSTDHDLLFSRFGIMFFENPIAAFKQLRCALVPGGRVVFICWQAPKENRWLSIAGQAV
ncbi:MAG: methyltransferase domain-containing protein, partial [Pseudomonadota bacterium]